MTIPIGKFRRLNALPSVPDNPATGIPVVFHRRGVIVPTNLTYYIIIYVQLIRIRFF